MLHAETCSFIETTVFRNSSGLTLPAFRQLLFQQLLNRFQGLKLLIHFYYSGSRSSSLGSKLVSLALFFDFLGLSCFTKLIDASDKEEYTEAYDEEIHYSLNEFSI